MIEKQEIYCHGCGNYVQFDIDMNLNGNHVLKCPKCGHEHCRVVENGVVTDDRWDSRNGNTYNVTSTITYSAISTWTTYSSNSTATSTLRGFLYNSWINVTATT